MINNSETPQDALIAVPEVDQQDAQTRARTAYGKDYDQAQQEYDNLSERRRRAQIVREVTNRLYKGQTKSGLQFVTLRGQTALQAKVMQQEMSNIENYYKNGGGMVDRMSNSNNYNSFASPIKGQGDRSSFTPMRYSSKFASTNQQSTFWQN